MKMGTENEGISKNEDTTSETRELLEGQYSRRDFLKILGSVALAAAIPKNISNNIDFEYTEPVDNSLAEAAHSYVAKTPEQTVYVSENLMCAKGFHPSNICGPLSIAIMSDWRLQNDSTVNVGPQAQLSGVAPSDMWLASPTGDSTDPKLFNSVFPPSEFNTYRITESIKSLDFNNIPNGVGKLKPGDFLYLDGGSFTHFITVSRKDKNGCIYATTNIPTQTQGEFVIEEVMLWDPIARDGYFRNWANGVGYEKAYTGRAGFYLWRRKEQKEQVIEESSAQELRNSLTNFFREQVNGTWNVSFVELGVGKVFGWRDSLLYNPTSTIKVPIAMILVQLLNEKYANEISASDLTQILKKNGVDGRSFDQLIHSMLVDSEEEATESCVKFIEQNGPITEKFKNLGMENTTYLPKRTSQKELAICWRELFQGDILNTESKKYLQNYLKEYTENDESLLSSVTKKFSIEKPWNKEGIVFSNGLYTMQDTGVIKLGEKLYYIGISGTSSSLHPISENQLKDVIGKIIEIMEKYAVAQKEKKRLDY